MKLFASVTEKQKAAISHWWVEFEKNSQEIANSLLGSQSAKHPLSYWTQWINENLDLIENGLNYEMGPGVKKGLLLAITPEAAVHKRPIVRYMLEQAPEITDWEFYEYRQPKPLDTISHFMGTDYNLDTTNLRFNASIDDTLHRINIVFYFSSQQDEDKFNALFTLTEHLLGEEYLDKWVGFIDYTDTKTKDFETKGQEVYNVSEMNTRVYSLVESIKSSVNGSLCAGTKDMEMSFYKLKPIPREEYREREDAIVYLFPSTKLGYKILSATHNNDVSFFSERFSSSDIFIYLKMDGSGDDAVSDEFPDKSSIQNALESAFSENRLGCIIGGGSGLKYSYIELAISDLDKSVATIKNTLQKGGIAKRSWILFHDAYLSAEWIGIYDDSPEPPMHEYEVIDTSSKEGESIRNGIINMRPAVLQ